MRILGNFKNIREDEKEKVFVNARFNGFDNSIKPFAIGGSDISIILGINPWTSPRELYKIKTEKIITPTNSAMECGKRFEEHIRLAFERKTGFKTKPCHIQVAHSKYPHVVYNADGFVEINGRLGLIEIKSTSADNFNLISNWKKGVIPPYYLCQGAFGMGIYELDFIVYILGYGLRDENISYVIVSRDKELEEDLYDIAENFVLQSSAGVIPNISGVTYQKVLDNLRKEIKIEEKPTRLPHNVEMADIVNLAISKMKEAANIKSQAKRLDDKSNELKKEATELLAPIFETLGSKVAFENSIIEYKLSKREGIDKNLLLDKYPQIFNEVLKTTESKSLSIRKMKKGEM